MRGEVSGGDLGLTPLSVAGVALDRGGMHMAAQGTAVPAERNMLDRYFKVTEAGSTIGTEVRGGLTNFLVMSYILVVNAIILSSAGVPFGEIGRASCRERV